MARTEKTTNTTPDITPSTTPATLGRRAAHLIRANWRVLAIAICSGIFLLILNDVLAGELLRIDQLAYDLIVQRMRTPALTSVMEMFSHIATAPALITILLVIFAFAPDRKVGWLCTVNLVLATLLNQVLKLLIQRPRPDVALRLVEVGGFSFPSGHSMASMAFFGLLIWLVWHYEKDLLRRVNLCLAFGVVILAVGFSRIYLGVHFASDVVGGFCASIVWLAIFTHVIAPLLFGQDGESAATESSGAAR